MAVVKKELAAQAATAAMELEAVAAMLALAALAGRLMEASRGVAMAATDLPSVRAIRSTTFFSSTVTSAR